MDELSTREAAQKWGVSLRQVQRLLNAGRIPGAKKYGVSWLIPAGTKKPDDPRRAQEHAPGPLFLTASELKKGGMDESKHPLIQADLAFRRGDAEPAKRLYRAMADGDELKLSAASLATAAAISSGDYALYDEIQRFLGARIASAKTARDRALLALPGTMAAVSMALPGMTPDWLKGADFSLFPFEMRPFLLYLYALHLRNTGHYFELLGVGEATLMLCEKKDAFTWLDVYLDVLCAVAACALNETARAARYLDAALALAVPYKMLAPFADHMGELGGALETAVERNCPGQMKTISALWSASFTNWMRFHNAFSKDNIATILTPREYQTAYLIAHRATYAEAARRMGLSVSRVKNILADVYAKLYIQNKRELDAFIL